MATEAWGYTWLRGWIWRYAYFVTIKQTGVLLGKGQSRSLLLGVCVQCLHPEDLGMGFPQGHGGLFNGTGDVGKELSLVRSSFQDMWTGWHILDTVHRFINRLKTWGDRNLRLRQWCLSEGWPQSSPPSSSWKDLCFPGTSASVPAKVPATGHVCLSWACETVARALERAGKGAITDIPVPTDPGMWWGASGELPLPRQTVQPLCYLQNQLRFVSLLLHGWHWLWAEGQDGDVQEIRGWGHPERVREIDGLSPCRGLGMGALSRLYPKPSYPASLCTPSGSAEITLS